jgi:ribonuclease BN (tRNA processing enzyme)
VTSNGAQGDVSRRGVLGAVTASVVAGALLGPAPEAHAASPRNTRLSLTLLGTAGGPPPVAGRYGISSALVVNGRTYVVDCGRGSLNQFVAAGLSMPSLAGVFLTHLHSDHTVDCFSYPLLAGMGLRSPVDVYGPTGTSTLIGSSILAFKQSTDFFLAEHIGVDPANVVRAHDIAPPDSAHSSPTNTAPDMPPFTVLENDDLRVSAILVPHGAVYPAYAYRFDTVHGSVVFSGDTTLTPNIPRLAHHANLLVHEAVATDVLADQGLPPALIDHIRHTHTEIDHLGPIAAESGVRGIVATHFGPADPALMSTKDWLRRLRHSARTAGYRGQLTVGTDLLRVPLPRS